MELLGLKLVAFLLIFVTGGGAGSGSSASCGASWPQPTSTSRTARQKHEVTISPAFFEAITCSPEHSAGHESNQTECSFSNMLAKKPEVSWPKHPTDPHGGLN